MVRLTTDAADVALLTRPFAWLNIVLAILNLQIGLVVMGAVNLSAALVLEAWVLFALRASPYAHR